MSTQMNTPIKQINHSGLKRVNSQQQYMPATMQQQVSQVTDRLKLNAKIIDMINNSRFQRSKSRRKEHLSELQSITADEQTSKKVILDEIVGKLDSALLQSRTSLDISRRYNSESKQTRQIEQKLKAFEDALKQIKQDNIQNQQKINAVKNQYQHQSSRIKIQQRIHQPQIKNNNYNAARKSITLQKSRQRRPPAKRIKNEGKYAIKGHYVYPKYIRPQRNYINRPTICILPSCRDGCKCKKQ